MTRDKFPRMTEWLLITIILLVLIGIFAPQQLPVSLYKLSLITMAAVTGYWIDRSVFPYARPDDISLMPSAILQATAQIRRAIIIGAAMLAVSLGA